MRSRIVIQARFVDDGLPMEDGRGKRLKFRWANIHFLLLVNLSRTQADHSAKQFFKRPKANHRQIFSLQVISVSPVKNRFYCFKRCQDYTLFLRIRLRFGCLEGTYKPSILMPSSRCDCFNTGGSAGNWMMVISSMWIGSMVLSIRLWWCFFMVWKATLPVIILLVLSIA